jgi:hypothetical protein
MGPYTTTAGGLELLVYAALSFLEGKRLGQRLWARLDFR